MNSTSSDGQQRIDWIDCARGICIIAVVAMYGTGYVEQAAGRQGWMHYFVQFAQPFRMPDFFFLSGLFVPRVLSRDLRRYLDTKVVHFLYFYGLWMTLKFVLADLPALYLQGSGAAVRSYLMLFVQPEGPLWFIYMLALFFLVIRWLRFVPPTAVIVAFVVFKLADPETGWKLFDRFAMYFMFFYGGSICSAQVSRAMEAMRSRPRVSWALLALWAGANEALAHAGLTFFPVVHLVTGFVGAFAILLLSTRLCEWRHTRWLRYMGRNSIVVYLGFVVPQFAMRKVVLSSLSPLDVGTASAIVIGSSIIGALVMHRALSDTAAAFLYTRPGWAHLAPPPQQSGVAAESA